MSLYWRRVQHFVRRLTNLSADTDVETTVNSIKKDIDFKGANVWILFFAIIVASIGLNMNSTAVIIGAMLISPLMGPINGIGLSIGINDSDLLKKSIKNLLVMVVISLVASTAYFLISPLSDAQSELLARTTPTIFDVMIAFFGGAAGIVASSRKEGKFTIIAGVAIATALMPPLCTAGYGLATGQFNYFLGAFYLFFINSFFIALSTFVMVRYMRFPRRKYVDAQREKMVKRTITVFSIIVIVPSVFMAWGMVAETRFNSQAIRYVHDIQQEDIFDEIEIINVKRNYSSKEKEISLSLVGKTLEQRQIERLQNRLVEYGLNNTKLTIKQTTGTLDIDAQANVLSKLLDRKDELLQEKDLIITGLNKELDELTLSGVDHLQLAREIAVEYPNVKRFSISRHSVYTDVATNQLDTIPTLFVEWINPKDTIRERKLNDWLKVRLGIDELKIIEIQ
ncbi:TIGR00341 family protein [Paludibacter sp. 221]|uniref:TIGR00341 family protein n=1 Tax=Paludibacter sp. 221 TaxID=2302939 RepID=UPI0013D83EC1|nr:TIGR00341 family protein [Paludibacter sp. 221]